MLTPTLSRSPRIVPLAYGVVSFLPGVARLRDKGTGGTGSARYCYAVWLRHLVSAARQGLDARPATVAEIGPGDSLGIGLAALIVGAERYVALDVVEHADVTRNLAVFDALVELVAGRADIPGDDEFPRLWPRLDDYRFPEDVLDDARLDAALAPDRIRALRAAVEDPTGPDSPISYRAPWANADVVEASSMDAIFSQAVLEHVDDLREAYGAMHGWLKPDGWMSHVIDFKSHRLFRTWNGHWTCPDPLWRLLRGRRAYLINRAPMSRHLAELKKARFELTEERRVRTPSPHARAELSARFSDLSEADLTTSMAFVQAVPAY